MQEDMHYYGTYALARAAGLGVAHARVIAYAAQYVDDATANNSEVHRDGGMFEKTATAHTNAEAIMNSAIDHSEQRKVWVPFHFYPGGEGDSLSENLVCQKDSKLAQEMVVNHVRHAVATLDGGGLELIGIMAHVYADTFSHYGFSGVSSSQNEVEAGSFELDVKDPKVEAYVMAKFAEFLTKYSPQFIIKNFRSVLSKGASSATGALGHGAVATYPDRPFLKWRFNYSKDNKASGWRENQMTYLEGCEKLHNVFQRFATTAGISVHPVAFIEIKDKIRQILSKEADKKGRIEAWKEMIISGALFRPSEDEALDYKAQEWEQQGSHFEDLEKSSEMINLEVYRFHQAAAYHRNYTLKQLLPKYQMLVL